MLRAAHDATPTGKPATKGDLGGERRTHHLAGCRRRPRHRDRQQPGHTDVQKRQENAEKKRDIYEKYAQPLAADAVNLLWRLDEILFKQRAQYLALEAPATPFNEYKLISTCYRIGAVVGWIRAIRLEQSYLFYGEATSFTTCARR